MEDKGQEVEVSDNLKEISDYCPAHGNPTNAICSFHDPPQTLCMECVFDHQDHTFCVEELYMAAARAMQDVKSKKRKAETILHEFLGSNIYQEEMPQVNVEDRLRIKTDLLYQEMVEKMKESYNSYINQMAEVLQEDVQGMDVSADLKKQGDIQKYEAENEDRLQKLWVDKKFTEIIKTYPIELKGSEIRKEEEVKTDKVGKVKPATGGTATGTVLPGKETLGQEANLEKIMRIEGECMKKVTKLLNTVTIDKAVKDPKYKKRPESQK